MDRYNEIVRDAAAADGVTVQDFASYVNGLPDVGLGVDVRPDGIHLTEAAALQVSADWLEPLLVQGTGGTNSDDEPDTEPAGGPPPALSDEFSTSRGRLGLWQADTGQPWHQLGGSWEVDDGVAVGDGRDGSTIATVDPGGPVTSVELVAGDFGQGPAWPSDSPTSSTLGGTRRSGNRTLEPCQRRRWSAHRGRELRTGRRGRWHRGVDPARRRSAGRLHRWPGVPRDGGRDALILAHVGLVVPQGQRSTFDQISAVRQ